MLSNDTLAAEVIHEAYLALAWLAKSRCESVDETQIKAKTAKKNMLAEESVLLNFISITLAEHDREFKWCWDPARPCEFLSTFFDV